MAASAGDILRAAGVPRETDEVAGLGIIVLVEPDDIVAALTALKAEGYDQLVDLFATDRDDVIEVTYHVRVLSEMHDEFLRSEVAYDGVLPSVWQLYPAALYPEREAAELLGLTLVGHPNPRRLLTTEGVPPLLRRDEEPRDAEEVRYTP